jgi:hypothetical protein
MPMICPHCKAQLALTITITAEGAETQTDSVVGTLPLNDGSEYGVSKQMLDELAALYPAVDVLQQLRNIKGWLVGNPTRRKTRRGIVKFITAWMAKEQDRGGARGGGSGQRQDRAAQGWLDVLRVMRDPRQAFRDPVAREVVYELWGGPYVLERMTERDRDFRRHDFAAAYNAKLEADNGTP